MVQSQLLSAQGSMRLLDRMENGDILIVTKLDRLGRNAMDIRRTVEMLSESEIRVTAWHWAGSTSPVLPVR